MRGEHSKATMYGISSTGSSPHARGTRKELHRFLYDPGIIPACAGNTMLRRRLTSAPRDHPRMRGEHKGGTSFDCCVLGSSPHARGTLRGYRLEAGGIGIIPACAGNTRLIIAIWPSMWDHPRMRGEHKANGTSDLQQAGSSPHARGTRDKETDETDWTGIIPACAGNTNSFKSMQSSVRDHPRMRGEHIANVDGGPDMQGSSPHARGTLLVASALMCCFGIIPACAGNTKKAGKRWTPIGDHPRMRGEHHTSLSNVWDALGSSPHARGTHSYRTAVTHHVGIIPACAGNTCQSAGSWPHPWDHPRMRGEHGLERPTKQDRMGSSPHARGTRGLVALCLGRVGIIPACAGNTV